MNNETLGYGFNAVTEGLSFNFTFNSHFYLQVRFIML